MYHVFFDLKEIEGADFSGKPPPQRDSFVLPQERFDYAHYVQCAAIEVAGIFQHPTKNTRHVRI